MRSPSCALTPLSGPTAAAKRPNVLQEQAEKIAAESDWNQLVFPICTAAGIAAACAGNWMRAEEHHRAVFTGMKTLAPPYGTADRPLMVCGDALSAEALEIPRLPKRSFRSRSLRPM